MAKKYCYLFTEGDASMRELLGGKGANLAEMTKIGLPVPQGFTISTVVKSTTVFRRKYYSISTKWKRYAARSSATR